MTWSTVCFFRKLCTQAKQNVHRTAVSMCYFLSLPLAQQQIKLLPGCATMQSTAAVWPRVLHKWQQTGHNSDSRRTYRRLLAVAKQVMARGRCFVANLSAQHSRALTHAAHHDPASHPSLVNSVFPGYIKLCVPCKMQHLLYMPS